VAGEVAGEGAHAGHHHQVAEREDRAEGPHGHDVPEEDEAVVVALEAATAAEVHEHELGRLGDAGPDDRLGPHRHGAVGDDHGRVHRQPGTEHAHAHQPPVAEGEREERQEGAGEQPAAGHAVDRARRDLEADPGQRQPRQVDARVPEVGAEGWAEHAEHDPDDGGEEHGGHEVDRTGGRAAGRGGVSRRRAGGRGRRRT